MLLTIDIGNTNIDLGLFQGDLLRDHEKWSTRPEADDAFHADRLRRLLDTQLRGEALHGVAIGSVVSRLSDRLSAILAPLCAGPLLQVEGNRDLDLAVDYDHPERVGVDRLLAAAAARHLVPSTALLIADVGTAITVDAVDAQGTFKGGLILPGLRLWLRSLRSGTSLLPEIEPSDAAPLLGRNTAACIQAGALHGGAALLDGLAERFASALGEPPETFLTGGDAPLLWPQLSRYRHHRPDLVLCGLRLAYDRHLESYQSRSSY